MTRTIGIITTGTIMRIGRIDGIWRSSIISIGNIRGRVTGGKRLIGGGGMSIGTEVDGNWKLEIGRWKIVIRAGGAKALPVFFWGEDGHGHGIAAPLRRWGGTFDCAQSG
jgi:hypothetical protein